jgi:hypothetical protein
MPFLLWTVAITLLAVNQNRFGRVALVNLAICFALGARDLARALPRRGVVVVLALPLALVVLDPSLRHYLELLRRPALPGEQEAGVFLRDVAPEPCRGNRSGVLTAWDQSHFIVRYAERPVTATGFAFYVGDGTFERVQALWNGTEQDLLAFMDARDLGFVVQGARTFAKMQPLGGGTRRTTPSAGNEWNPDPFAEVPLTSLVAGGSGIPEMGLPHLEHLMPRFASAEFQTDDAPAVWAYERVPGATLEGTTAAGARVELTTGMRVRSAYHAHVAWTRADGAGHYRLTTALPTDYPGRGFRTSPTALLSIGPDVSVAAVISEEAVRTGRRITPMYGP